MKMKTTELQGPALDWAVAKCGGHEVHVSKGGWIVFDTYQDDPPAGMDPFNDARWQAYTPSTDWSQGGPIIERESICIGSGMDAPTWYANKGLGKYHQFGTTPLIAAMRCYVASKLGDEVEVPDEIL